MLELQRHLDIEHKVNEFIPIEFDVTDFTMYTELFNQYRTMGLIEPSTNFNDTSWLVHSVTQSYKFNYTLTDIQEKQLKANEYGLSPSTFITALKCYTLSELKTMSPSNWVATIASIKKTAIMSAIYSRSKYPIFKGYLLSLTPHIQPRHQEVINFAEFIGIDISEKYEPLILDQIERFYTTYNKSVHNRSLPSFELTFMLNDYITDFVNGATDIEFEQFFPTIFWWSLSTIIPIRPTELLLTINDCVASHGDTKTLTISRTNQKGHHRKYRYYSVNDFDTAYRLQTVHISDHLYNLINRYKALVDATDTNRRFLLSKVSFQKWCLGSHRTDPKSKHAKYITYSNLKHNITTFYLQVLEKNYGIQLIDSENSARGKMLFKAMDTRHFAIMNMVLMGFEPPAIMELAGHTDMLSATSYYSHIKEYANCYAISLARKKALNKLPTGSKTILESDNNKILSNIKGTTYNTKKHSNKLALLNNKYVEVSSGFCTYTGKDFAPCLKCDGVHERCEFFISDDKLNTGVLKTVNDIDREIEIQVITLLKLVSTRRKIENFEDLYGVTINKIFTGSNTKADIFSNFVGTNS